MNQLPDYKKKDIEEAPADVHNNMSVDLCVEGYLDVSIAEFGKALRENPNYPVAYFNRGIASANLGLQKACLIDMETVRILMRDFRLSIAKEKLHAG